MNERGFALVTVVLILIGLALLATGLVYGATQQSTITASLRDLVRARHGAEGALERATSDWNAARRALDPIGADVHLLVGVHLEPDLRVDVAARRLSGSAWLLTGSASVARGSLPAIVQGARRIIRSLDADSIGAALDAAVIPGAVRVDAGATVSGGSESDTTAAEDTLLCARWAPTGAALRAPPESVTVSGAALVTGTPPLQPDAEVARFREGIGFLDTGRLAAAADVAAGSVVTPMPATLGAACDTMTASNWGAPDGPCSGRYVLVHAQGPFVMDGGFGQGVLIVDGDAILDGGARFRGIVLATGSVTVTDAAVSGTIAARRVHVEAPGRALLDRCAIAAALTHVAGLRRAWIPARSWLPTFP